LQNRDERPILHKALRAAPITFESREIHSSFFDQSAISHSTESGNQAGTVLHQEWKVT